MERGQDQQAERQADSASSQNSERGLSSQRLADHLANERTLLAWGRTGVAIIALGFVVARFGLLIRALERSDVSSGVLTAAGVIGVALTLFGALLTALSLVRYLQIRRGIERGAPEVEARLGITMAVGLTVAGLTLAGYLAFAH